MASPILLGSEYCDGDVGYLQWRRWKTRWRIMWRTRVIVLEAGVALTVPRTRRRVKVFRRGTLLLLYPTGVLQGAGVARSGLPRWR
jgi:hypothetical protein